MADPHGPWPVPEGWNGAPLGWQGAGSDPASWAGPVAATTPGAPSVYLGPAEPWWAGANPVQWYAARPARSGLRLLPMTIGDLLDLTFRLFKANLRSVFPILVVVVVPWEVLRAIGATPTFSLSQVLSQLGAGAAPSANSAAGADRAFALLSSLGLLLFQPLATGAVTRAVVARFRNDAVPNALGLMRGGTRWVPSILVASLLGHIPIAAGTLLFVVPGLIFWALWSVTAPVAAAEGLGPWKALGRSWRLVSGRGWPVLGNLLLGGLVVVVSVNLLSGGPVIVIDLVANGRLAVDLTAVVSTFAAVFQYGLYATLVALVYINLRVRLEGLDLDAVAALASAPA